MFVLRHTIALILVALLLPVGAFVKTFPPGKAPDASVERVFDALQGVIPAKRKCGSGALPGSHCGPDMMSRRGGAVRFAPAFAVLAFRHDDWRAVGVSQSPATGPPRLS